MFDQINIPVLDTHDKFLIPHLLKVQFLKHEHQYILEFHRLIQYIALFDTLPQYKPLLR